MKPEQIVLVSPQGWFEFAHGQVREIQPWPTLQGPTAVVVDFPDAQVGVQFCKGKPAYAAAQIERTVRDEGLIEGAVQVCIHRQIGHEDSSQSLYTAVSLPQWQELQSWAARQTDHCMVMPLAGLLAVQRGGDEALVLRSGSQLHVFGEHDGRMHYAAAAALGTDPSDFLIPVRAALGQLKLGGWKGSPRACRWAAVRASDLASEQRLVDALAEAGVADAKLLPHESYGDDAQAFASSSALPVLLQAVPSRAWAVPTLRRLAWFSERHVLPLAATVAVVAVGLGVFAFLADRTANEAQLSAAALRSEVEELRQRIGVASDQRAAAMDAPELMFARQMGFAVVHDPVRMLATVRKAAGQQIRIQRVQLTKANPPVPARFRVDGVVADGSAEALSRFLAELRADGWQAESTAPGDSASGAFAYYLRAAPGRDG